MNKKAQIEQIGAIIVPLVGIGIVLAIGFLIFAEVKDQAIDMSSSMSLTNNTLTVTLDSFSTMNFSCIFEEDATVTELYNGSSVKCSNVVLGVGNYTISGRTINVSDDSIGGIGGVSTTLFANYSCIEHSYAINGTRSVQNATDDIPGWLPIIVITIIGVILIGLVSIFRRRV